MMTQSLANKYRSTNFDDLVGQDHIAHILKYQAAHHTRQANYLFFGPRGTGKTSSARLFAKAINCLQTSDGNPCNECENCIAISKGATMDIMEIDAASHTGVDNIREEVIDKLMYRPSQLKKRVTIIDEVHMLSKGAFNALLKTMEEPTERMVFILATTELNKVPDTIVSRCQVFNFKKISSPLIVQRLEYISQQENISSTSSGLTMIASLADGCMRDAVKYLDQISVMGEVDEEKVSQFLGVVSDQSIAEFVNHFQHYIDSKQQHEFQQIVKVLEQLSQQGVDLSLFPKQLMDYADRHFLTNTQLFSQLSSFAGQVLAQAKRYPHPLLLYKTLLSNLSHQGLGNDLSSKDSNSPSPSPQAPRDKSGSDLGHHSSPNNIQGTTNSQQESDKSSQQSVQDNHESAHSSSLDVIYQRALNLLSPSLQRLLAGQSELVSIDTHAGAQLIVTNPLAKISLSKKDSHDLICQALSSTSDLSLSSLNFSFMSKEEYFAHQLQS